MDILQLVLVFDYENQRRQILQAQLLDYIEAYLIDLLKRG